jgi:hypothetical protein
MIDTDASQLSRATLSTLGVAFGVYTVAAVMLAFAPTATAAADLSWQEVEQWIWNDAAEFGVSGQWLIWVARCEAAGDPFARGARGEVGPFQWLPWAGSLWWSTPAGRAGISPWDIRMNVRMAAWAWSRGLSHHWSCA